MKLTGLVVAVLCVFALLIATPRAVTQSPVQMQASLDVMKTNVAQIPASAEKDRWQANEEMWQIVIGHTQSVPIVHLGLLKSRFQEMQENVAEITEPKERERWQANVFMWQEIINHMEGGTHPLMLVEMKDPFGRMQANVARIDESPEKERWQANVDVWKIMIMRLESSTQ
ncbi:MAG TPA: hypothetical protein VLV89_00410 [Candidatus Acidoferrum sp.]|nr:hypothetical protein [Candidatus Acidoferrum sp.]